MYATMLDLLIWAQQPPFGPGPMRPGTGPGPGSGATGAGVAAGLICYFVFLFGMIAFFIMVNWKIFTKAGEPGWACLVPVYNGMVLSKICGRGEMFGLLLLVPCINIIVAIMLTFDLARVFGKDTGFAIGLLLLGIVFYPILAFGDAEYVGEGGPRRRRRRRRIVDDDDEDDRPRRRRPVDDDEDEDEPPRRRRPSAADERVQSSPRRRPPPPDDDDEEDEPPPRPRRPSAPDQRVQPPRRRPPPPDDDDDDEPPPPPRRRPAGR